MIVKIARKNFIVKAMDVESHNDDESIALGETSIWLGCYLDENSKVDDPSSYFYTIEEFINRTMEDTRAKRNKSKTRLCNNIVCYIYNLSFEWSFILPKLLDKGFQYIPKIDKNSQYCYNSTSTKTCSSVWEVNIKYAKNGGILKLRDLAKQFSGGLGKVAKSFGISTQKGEIDYRKNRLHDYIVTDEEKEYCFKDTRIIIEILEEIYKKEDKQFWNTISMASYSMKKLIDETWGMYRHPMRIFRKVYPKLDEKENNFLRKSIEGGITYSPPKWQYIQINAPVLHIDAHQMYPSQMYANLYPYGEGHYFYGEPRNDKLCCCRCIISYNDVLLHSKVQLIGYQGLSDYEITLWNFEIALMKEVYIDLEIKYLDGYWYDVKRLPFRKFYKENYDKRKIAKQNKDNFNILYYKLLNNASYGKFIEKGHEFAFKNTIINGIIDSIPIEKEKKDYLAKYTYVPIGSCTTAYARVCLIRTALKFGWEKVLYFDTDSIFVLYDEETKKVWETINQKDDLGGWGLEEINQQAQFTAPKRYKLESDGKTIVKAGGINFSKFMRDNNISELEFRETNIESSTWMVQRAYRVRGGTLIDFQRKDITIPDKYKNVYEQNKGIVYSIEEAD